MAGYNPLLAALAMGGMQSRDPFSQDPLSGGGGGQGPVLAPSVGIGDVMQPRTSVQYSRMPHAPLGDVGYSQQPFNTPTEGQIDIPSLLDQGMESVPPQQMMGQVPNTGYGEPSRNGMSYPNNSPVPTRRPAPFQVQGQTDESRDRQANARSTIDGLRAAQARMIGPSGDNESAESTPDNEQAEINRQIAGGLAQARGGLMTNGQMAGLPMNAQAQVNHTAGGQFGGLPQIPQMTALDTERALSVAMENHDFNGAVARQDASGRAYFADPTPQAPMPSSDSADAGLAAKGFLKTDQGWRPSAGRAEQVRRMPGAIVPQQQQEQMGGDGGVGVPTFSSNGLLPEAQRRALVTRNAQSRGMERDLRMGNHSPESILLSQLQSGGGDQSNPMMAGMMFGGPAYAAQLQAQQIPAQYAQQMAIMQAQANAAMQQQQANHDWASSPAGMFAAGNNAGTDPKITQGHIAGIQGFGSSNPLAANSPLDPLIDAHPPSYQGYVAYMKAAQANGVNPQQADAAWKAKGRTTEQGVFSGASSNPLVNAGSWLGSLFTGVR